DGKIVAAVEFNKVRLWDSATGKELRCFPLVSAGGSDRSGESVAFAPDGQTLAVGGAGTVLLHARSGEGLQPTDAARTFSVSFAPDEKTLAAAQFSGGVLLVETATGKTIVRLNGSERREDKSGRTWSVSYSADGRSLAWGEGPLVYVWDARGTRK